MLIGIVKGKIIAGKHAQLRQTADILEKFAADEPGCEQYEFFVDGNTLLAIERWASHQALDMHLNSTHFATHAPKLRECVEGGLFDVQFIETDKVTFAKI
jgi:hypothetical protein